MRSILIPHPITGAGRVQAFAEHQPARLLEPQPFLKLQWTRLPAPAIAAITEQGQLIERVTDISEIWQEGETTVLCVSSGHYHFAVKASK